MLAERCWSPRQSPGLLVCSSAGNHGCLKTRDSAHGGGARVKLSGKMLSQRCQKCIPPLVTNGRWLVLQQRGLSTGLLPPVLLEELPYELPPNLWEARARRPPSSAKVVG
jgi:hypothetical protein